MSIADKLATIAENEKKVYDKGFELGTLHGYDEGSAEGYSRGYGMGVEEGYTQGYTAGKTEGKTEGYNEGVQAEYDRFWDEYQKDSYNRIGNRYEYTNAFTGNAWRDTIYKPKWDFGELKTVEIDGMQTQVRRVKYAAGMFWQAQITDTLKPIDFTEVHSSANNIFMQASSLKTIRTLTVVETVNFKSWFAYANALENITFEGVIGQDIDFKWSTKLSKASITNIIEHLSAKASGKTLTLSKTAVNTAFNMTDDNPSTEWSNLVGTKQNWTISLV